MNHRVVVTGLGVVSSLGEDKEKFWDALLSGKSGIKRVTRFDASRITTQIAGQIDEFDPNNYLDKKEARRMDRNTQFAVAATAMAMKDSGLDLAKENRERIGVIFGSGIGGIQTLEEQARVLVEKGPGRISPFFVPMMIPNMAAGQIGITFGLKGPNITTVTACASSNNAIGEAFEILQRGEADLIVTGGSEAPATELSMGGFCAMKAMSTRNDEPEKASRPFDLGRDGFVLGEGSGVIILETLEHALNRGAKIYAEISGYGSTCDAYHITAPDPVGAGAARAMKLAIEDAGMQPGEISYINAHGTSTAKGDIGETLAIKSVFGEDAKKVAISSTKSMTGHLLGAAGGIEAVATILAIVNNEVPPTINLDDPDPECDLDYVPNKSRKMNVQAAISNSFGFGGHNAVILFKKYQG